MSITSGAVEFWTDEVSLINSDEELLWVGAGASVLFSEIGVIVIFSFGDSTEGEMGVVSFLLSSTLGVESGLFV